MRKILAKINWLIVALIVTIAYVALIVWKVGFWNIWTFLSSERLNEVGDFIAGVFSPLAFIWLVAAVLTQRQELTETRDQFAENQKVVDAQLRTINDQSGLLMRQNALAEDTSRKTYRLSLFEQRFKLYNEFVLFGETWVKRDFLDSAHLEMIELRQKARFLFPSDVIEWFEDIESMLIEVAQLHNGYSRIEVTDHGIPLERWTNEQMKMEFLLVKQKLSEQFFNAEIRNDKFANAMSVSD